MPEPRTEVEAIAAEHVAWAQSRGLTQHQVMASIGEPSQPFITDWDDARFAVAIKWLDLRSMGRLRGQ